jgi:hypothetical protein
MSIKESKLKLNKFITFLQDSIDKIKASLLEDTQLDNIQKDLKDVKNQLEFLNRLRIVITGNNKSGKSCLINTILESEILYSNEESATESVLIIKPVRNKQPTLWRCKMNTETLTNASYITYFDKLDEDVLATGYLEVKKFIKEINIKIKKQNSKEQLYYILEHEIPIFNELPDEIFNMIELIDCPGLNNHERKKIRREMIPALFSSLVCFLYVTKIDSYQTDSEYKSFNDIMSESIRYGVLQEEQMFEIIVNKIDNLDGKKDSEKEMALKSVKDYYDKHFKCNKDPLPYSSLNKLKYMSLETFFRVKYANYEKDKISFPNFQRCLNCQYLQVKEDLDEQGLIGIIKESSSPELTYIADNYTHYNLDYQLLKKYSLIYEYGRYIKEPNILHGMLIKNIRELDKVLLKKILRKVNNSVESINSQINLSLVNEDLVVNTLDVENAKCLHLNIVKTLDVYDLKLKDCIGTMEGKLKSEHEKLADIENINDIDELSKTLKLFEKSTEEISKSYEEEFGKINQEFNIIFENILDEFYKLVEKIKLVIPKNKESYSKIFDNSLNYNLPGSPFKAFLKGFLKHLAVRGLMLGVGAGVGIGIGAYAATTTTTAFTVGVSLLEVGSLMTPVGWIVGGVLLVSGIGLGIYNCIDQKKTNLNFLKEQYFNAKDEIDNNIKNQRFELERLIIKLRRFIDEDVISVIETIIKDRSTIQDNMKTLTMVQVDINQKLKQLNNDIMTLIN